MLKTSLEIAFRLIFHDFLTHGRERVNYAVVQAWLYAQGRRQAIPGPQG